LNFIQVHMKLINVPLRAAALHFVAAMVALTPAAAFCENVPIAPVKNAGAASSYVLDGVIQAVKQSTVAAQASGRIASFSVKAGDRIRSGQVLATIDDREAQVGVARAQAQISQADAELRNAKAQMERTRDLQAQGFVSKAAFDTANTQYQAAQAQRDQAIATARQSGIAQGFTRVTAPMDGWVLQTFAQAGDLAVPGTPLLVVYAPQPLRAVVQVPASRSLAVRQASQTLVLIDRGSGSGQSISPLNRLEVPSSDPVSQTTEWRMDLPAREAASLLPGQQVRVSFVVDADSTVARLLVPATAVVRRNELTAVYVVANQRFALRAVRLGADLGSQGVEVLSGLRAGEWVATDTLRASQSEAVPAAR
jgi:RND family efflux transporter MFP subunit